jgi:hypothetical protein
MRFIGLDVHRDFCEVAIAEAGGIRREGRVRTEPAELELMRGVIATRRWSRLLALAPEERVGFLEGWLIEAEEPDLAALFSD